MRWRAVSNGNTIPYALRGRQRIPVATRGGFGRYNWRRKKCSLLRGNRFRDRWSRPVRLGPHRCMNRAVQYPLDLLRSHRDGQGDQRHQDDEDHSNRPPGPGSWCRIGVRLGVKHVQRLDVDICHLSAIKQRNATTIRLDAPRMGRGWRDSEVKFGGRSRERRDFPGG